LSFIITVTISNWYCIGLKNLAADALSAGVPSFVVQEEFDRFTGFWWQPSTTSTGNRLFYSYFLSLCYCVVSLLAMLCV